jgi:hypothetical protein
VALGFGPDFDFAFRLSVNYKTQCLLGGDGKAAALRFIPAHCDRCVYSLKTSKISL